MERAYTNGALAKSTTANGSKALSTVTASGKVKILILTSANGRTVKLTAMESIPGLAEINTKENGKND